MNFITPITRRSLKMTTKTALAALAAVGLCTSPTNAALVDVNSGQSIDGSIDASAGSKTISINAGATADFLIIGTSTEFGSGSIAGWSVTYDGNEMEFATGNGAQGNIFYLDLTQTTYSGGSANLSLSWDYTAGGDLGIGWVSIREDSGLGPGESIELHSTAAQGGASAVSLATTVDDTFNFVNFNANRGAGTTFSGFSGAQTQLYANASFGSNGGGAVFDENNAAGTYNYDWNHNEDRRKDAAAFVVVPEPGSLALLAAGGLLMIKRRRRSCLRP